MFAACWQGRSPQAPLCLLRKIHLFALGILIACFVTPGCGTPLLYGDTSNPIQKENSLPGTPGWDHFSASKRQDLLSGFGSSTSVNHGDSISFYVTTTAPSFTIDIYRTGYYQGIGARLVQSLGRFPGVRQAIPPPDPVTGMIACSNWVSATTLQIPFSWVTGIYLAKLTSTTGNSSFIFFVVRNDGGKEDILFQASVNTYQAYNQWGGTSLYGNSTDLSVYPYKYATKVSFDRPFDPAVDKGAGQYLQFEYVFVYWMESQGYDVSYTTDIDTDQGTEPIAHHKAFLSVGHDEYWSRAMRTNVQNAIDAGIHVGFFGSNTMFWQIRYESNAAGVPNRVEVGYKYFAFSRSAPGPDPEWGVNNSIVTTLWRDPVINEPENGIVGIMYEGEGATSYVVQNPSNWVYANTGFVEGSSVPGIVGYEYDKIWNNGFTPPGLILLSDSPLTDSSGANSNANSSIYTAPSGANVFASGSNWWSRGLANVLGYNSANSGIQQATANLLNRFILGTPETTLGPSAANFNSALVGATSAPQTITLTNYGTGVLNITTISVTGVNAADFAQTNDCSAALDINQSCTMNVTFTPTATGTRSASLTITDNAVNIPQEVSLVGTGQAFTLIPTSLNFPSQNSGSTSSSQIVTLTNSAAGALNISSITASGDFAQTNNCGSGLAPKGACAISVTFTPTAGGSRTGTLTITDNQAGSPQTIALSGTGSTVKLSASSTSLDISSGRCSTGTMIQISPEGGFSGMVSLACTVTDEGSGLASDTTSCSLNPLQNQVSATGPVSATLLVNTGAPCSAQVAKHPFLPFGTTSLAAMLIFAGVRRKNLRGVWLLLFLFVLAISGDVGCTSTSRRNSPRNYNVAVTATSGTVTAKLTIPLSVE